MQEVDKNGNETVSGGIKTPFGFDDSFDLYAP